VRKKISADATAIAARNLQVSGECRDLSAAFAAAGLPLLFLKGLTLAELAYCDVALKSAIDIDLLIDPADLLAAARLLHDRDYRLAIPANEAALSRWHRRSKESVWIKRSPAFQIDLHTRCADNPRVIPGIDVHSPRQPVNLRPGVSLETLADEQLFAYLCVHGASSAWFRLKWLSDFAGFLHGRTEDELQHLYDYSKQLGSGRSPALALLLADSLFGTLEDAQVLREKLLADPAVGKLHEIALGLITHAKGEPTERPFGTVPIHKAQFLLFPAPGYKLSELVRQARHALKIL
jgi:hypothetical protein